MKIRNHVCESCGKGFRDNGMYSFYFIEERINDTTYSMNFYQTMLPTDMLYIHTLQHRGIKFPCFVPGKTILCNLFVLSHNFVYSKYFFRLHISGDIESSINVPRPEESQPQQGGARRVQTEAVRLLGHN